jgi:NADPH:quinone reductase-like Zn-dependent oxidoreductase
MTTEHKMKAVRIHDYGNSEVLTLEEVDLPRPQEGEVLLRVFAAGVNPVDWKSREGLYKQFMPLKFPWIPGLEGSGVVEAVGPGVTQFKPGQPVFGPFPGAYAEFAVAPQKDILLKPANISFDEAASIPIGALTAWSSVINAARVQPGQRVLVHGAAGGVGNLVVQLACWKGAYVIATTSTPNKDFVKSLGARQIIDYADARFENELQNVDVVIDTVGGDLPDRSLRLLSPSGYLISVGKRLPPEYGKDQGVQVLSPGRAPIEDFAQVKLLIETGVLIPHVYRSFKLSEAGAAQELSQSGHGQGRIILHISG